MITVYKNCEMNAALEKRLREYGKIENDAELISALNDIIEKESSLSDDKRDNGLIVAAGDALLLLREEDPGRLDREASGLIDGMLAEINRRGKRGTRAAKGIKWLIPVAALVGALIGSVVTSYALGADFLPITRPAPVESESTPSDVTDPAPTEETAPAPETDSAPDDIVPTLNRDVLDEYKMTYGELKEKHGKLVDYTSPEGGNFYIFENGYGSYGFDLPYNDLSWMQTDPESGVVYMTIDDGELCRWIYFTADKLFTESFETLTVDNISKIEGLTYLGTEDYPSDVERPYLSRFFYDGWDSDKVSLLVFHAEENTVDRDADVRIYISPADAAEEKRESAPALDEDLFGDLGLSFGELTAKRGDPTKFDSLTGRPGYLIGDKSYIFYGDPMLDYSDKSNWTAWGENGVLLPIPDENCKCVRIERALFSDLFDEIGYGMNARDLAGVGGIFITEMSEQHGGYSSMGEELPELYYYTTEFYTATGDGEKVRVTVTHREPDFISSGSTVEIALDSYDEYEKNHEYIGVWKTSSGMDETIVYEYVEGEKIVFHSGIYRTFGFYATAVWDGESYSFGDGISPGYSGPSGLKGKIDVFESEITVTYDDFGVMSSVVPGSEGWDYYVFTTKEPLP